MRTNKLKKVSFITILIVIAMLVGAIYGYSRQSEAHASTTTLFTPDPVITILTHGLAGSAKDWYTDDHTKLAYSEDSIIEELRSKSNGEVYILYKNNTLHKLPIMFVNNKYQYPSELSNFEVFNIDITKHSVVIFEQTGNFYDDLNTVYADFKESIDWLVNDYITQSGGIVPRINLIGHSRGTAVNLKYAIDYPQRVASMFALGGVFNGSVFAKLILGIKPSDHIFPDSGLIDTLNSKFVKNLADPVYMGNLKSAWNAEEVQSAGIIAYAVASSFDLSFLKVYVDSIDSLHPALKLFIKSAISLIGTFPITDVLSPLVTSLRVFLAESLLLPDATVLTDNVLQSMLSDIIIGLTSGLVIPHDGLMSKSSQSAEGYDGFERFYKTYTRYNCDFSRGVQGSVSNLPHNLETMDRETIAFILSKIDVGNDAVYRYKNYEDGVKITAYSGSVNEGDITIPSQLGGKAVKAIGGFTFSGNDTITEVTVPSSVEVIEYNAFNNCTSLSTVTIDGNQLTEIGNGAFFGCKSLTNFTMPFTVQTIGDRAFFGCSALSSLSLPQSLNQLGELCFGECPSLAQINMDSNTSFKIVGGSLYNGNITKLLRYMPANTAESFSVPDTVTAVEKGAFEDASITSVDLNNVAVIMDGAFRRASLTSITIGDNVENIGFDAFYDCSDLSIINFNRNGAPVINSYAFYNIDRYAEFYAQKHTRKLSKI